MNKTFAIITLLLCSLPFMAQKTENTKDYRHHIELSVGELFLWNLGAYYPFAAPYQPIQDAQQCWQDQTPYRPTFAKEEIIVPPINFGYYYQILDWLQVGGEIATATRGEKWVDVTNDQTKAFFACTNLYIAGGVRFNYYRKSILDLYSGLTLGASVHFIHTESNPLVESAGYVAWQITALGLRFGKRIYGVAEVGYGYKGVLSLGIGTRF